MTDNVERVIDVDAIADRVANIRQGESDTPRCEPPGAYEVGIAREWVVRVLKALPSSPPAEDGEVERLREVLGVATVELEVLNGPHILFDCHTHAETGEWMIGTDDNTFIEAGWPGWSNGENVRETLLEFNADDIRAVIGNAERGYVCGVIPVVTGKYPEDPPWEPVFSRAYLLDFYPHPTNSPALNRIRQALAGTKPAPLPEPPKDSEPGGKHG